MIVINTFTKDNKTCLYLSQNEDNAHRMIVEGVADSYELLGTYDCSKEQASGVINHLINTMHDNDYGVKVDNIVPPLTQFPIGFREKVVNFISNCNFDDYVGTLRHYTTQYSNTEKTLWEFVATRNSGKRVSAKEQYTELEDGFGNKVSFNVHELINTNTALRDALRIMAHKMDAMERRITELESVE